MKHIRDVRHSAVAWALCFVCAGGLAGCEPSGMVAARRNLARNAAEELYRAAEAFYLERGSAPRSVKELLAWAHGAAGTLGLGPSSPVDPWGKEYCIVEGECGILVVCFGRDGKPGGYGEDADILVGR